MCVCVCFFFFFLCFLNLASVSGGDVVLKVFFYFFSSGSYVVYKIGTICISFVDGKMMNICEKLF